MGSLVCVLADSTEDVEVDTDWLKICAALCDRDDGVSDEREES